MVSQKVKRRADRIISLFPKIMGSIAKMHPSGKYGVDLTFNQYQALTFIHELKECSVNELAMKLKIAQSTTSQLVDRLVKAGLVNREIQSTDRRKMLVSLSKTGKEMMDKRTKSLRESYQKILSMLDEADQQMFEEAFEKFHEIAVKLEQKLKHHGE